MPHRRYPRVRLKNFIRQLKRAEVPGSIEIDWTSCEPAVILPSIDLLLRLRREQPLMTDTQWLRIQPFLNACSGLYVGYEARGRRFAAVLCGMPQMGTPWRRWLAAYGKGNAVYRRYADGYDRASGRTGWPAYRPIQICLSCGRTRYCPV